MKIKVKVEGIAPLLMNKFSDNTQEASQARGKKVYDVLMFGSCEYSCLLNLLKFR